MTPLELVIARLDAAGCRPRGHHKIAARCPAHDDRHPSLSVAEADSGAALIHCHASCTPAAIVAALGLELRELFPDRTAFPAKHPSGLGRDFYIVNVLGENIEAPIAKSCDGVEIPALPRLHKAVLDVLHGHAFFAPTCCPSQALIAEQAGCARETVNRICRDLRDLGLIAWTRRRRPGSRWEHNVYQLLAHWHRPHRKAVMARIRAARDAIRVRLDLRDHTKRTATDVERDREGFWREQSGQILAERGMGWLFLLVDGIRGRETRSAMRYRNPRCGRLATSGMSRLEPAVENGPRRSRYGRRTRRERWHSCNTQP